MNTKIISLAAAFVLLLSQPVSATISALGITFHIFGSGPTDQQLADVVCELNSNFSQTEVRFYLNPVKHSSGSPSSEANALSLSPKEGQINIYEYGSSYYHSNAYGDAIYGPSLLATSQLTHEIGHMLNLLHPDGSGSGASACSSCTGGGDCCADTWPGMPNNWMNQGAFSGTFTGDQNTRMTACISSRGWTGGPGGLVSNVNRVVPYDYFTPGMYSAEITWMFPTLCNPDLPNYTEILVTTQCEEGANEYQLLYTCYDLTTPFYIPLDWGVTQIQFTYNYSGVTSVITRNYNANATNTSPCTLGGGDGKSTGVRVMTNPGQHYLLLLNNASSSVLNIRNSGYDIVTVYDMAGRKLQTNSITDGNGTIDVSGLATGIYILKAGSGGDEMHYRFQKL